MSPGEGMKFRADDPVERPRGAGEWIVLVVDDEEEVHHVTKLVLANFSFGGRTLRFLSAYDSEQARAVLREVPDVAVVLLDVVMDGEDAGLRLVRFIREELGNHLVRIVLRTGQPGYAPEGKVIVEYDINDYREKTELTAQKLYTTMVSAVRSYRDIITIEKSRLGLEKIIESSAHIFEVQSLKRFASGVLDQLVSLLNLDRDAIYLGSGGFTAVREGGGFVILAATGRYESAIGADVRAVAGPADVEAIEAAVSARRSQYRNDRYVGYIEMKDGRQNILFLEDCRNLSLIDVELVNIYCINVGVAFENFYLNREIEDSHRELIYMLGDLIERRSRETGNHVRRVSEFARVLAAAYDLPEEEADIVRVASALHDIGKIAIPDLILNKPERLTPEEFEVIKTHASLGGEMLRNSRQNFFSSAARIASEHHERWDGTGYPRGLKGAEIHLHARITAVADVLDALSSDRVYRAAWSFESAVRYIEAEAGRQFDPELVGIFLSRLDEFRKIRKALP